MSEKRVSEIQSTLNAMDGTWPHVLRELARSREQLVSALVTENDEQTRGKVKQIDALVLLPNTLRQELMYLIDSLSPRDES